MKHLPLVEALIQKGETTIADAMRETGLSHDKVRRALERLVVDGKVKQERTRHADTENWGGRPRKVFERV